MNPLRTLLATTILLGFAFATAPAPAAETSFSTPPKVATAGGKTTLSFTLAAPGDVEVAVLDAKGKVVRHLAAGVLGGKNPPPSPLKAGLAQSLEWDGKDDSGQAAGGGPFRVRVRAGMGIEFGRMIGGDPHTGSITHGRNMHNGLAVDDQGNLYVKIMSSVGSHGNSGWWPWHVRQFDRAGKYVRTLLPHSPTTDPAKASGMELLSLPGGEFAPALQNSLYPVFYNFGNDMGNRITNGRLLFIHGGDRRELNLFAIDGSNQVKTVPMWPGRRDVAIPKWLQIQVALSPDGKTAYLSNAAGTPYDGKKPEDIDPNWPQGRIYRLDLTKEGSSAETFFDLPLSPYDPKKHWMPSAWDMKTAAAGIDVDAQGNVLVGDLYDQKLYKISPAGKQLAAAPLPWPDRVVASRKGDHVYVVSRGVTRGYLPAGKLLKVKLAGNEARVVAELPLKGTLGGAIALDETGDAPVLWLGGSDTSGESKSRELLMRVEDRGGELVVTGDDFLNDDPNAIGFVGYMDVDREAELVYVTGSKSEVWRFDGRTGKGELLPFRATDIAIGPKGDVYTLGINGWNGPIARYTRDLDPAPLPGFEENTYGYVYGRAGRGISYCGFDIDARGRVFATYGSNACHVRAYDAAGELVPFSRTANVEGERGARASAAITGVSGYGGSLRVDLQGNMYLLQAGLPQDHQPPAGYEKNEAYGHTVGTIWKFGPDGGAINGRATSFENVQGALAAYEGCGPISQWRADGSCACTKPRFDVDGYGRLYIPNGTTFSVSVRDNADNEIVRFGSYGNFDSPGGAKVKGEPEIPLGWAIGAGASDAHVYVGDCLNHRLVRADKTWAAEATVDVK
ncbi:MAG: hypothetical protein WD069_01305 [Planctomycetales bacterium]